MWFNILACINMCVILLHIRFTFSSINNSWNYIYYNTRRIFFNVIILRILMSKIDFYIRSLAKAIDVFENYYFDETSLCSWCLETFSHHEYTWNSAYLMLNINQSTVLLRYAMWFTVTVYPLALIQYSILEFNLSMISVILKNKIVFL